MRKIGDVMRTLSIPINTETAAISIEPAEVNCPICKDAGWIRMDVPVGHPNFGRIFPCQCQAEQKESRQIEDLRRLSNLDAFTDRDFSTFESKLQGVHEAYAAATSYAQNPHGWLFLHGNCGVGKTHLATSIAIHAMENQKTSVLFAVVPDLLDHLRAAFHPDNGVAYDDRFAEVRNAQLLVLDDLGTENTTPWAREKLYQIFNHRYNEQLPTVVTSNQDFKKIDDRVLSRLLDTRLTTYIHIDADDYRRRRITRGRGGF
jgi:DNA replication protein DnaC